MATQQIINIGTLPNDSTGDPLRTGFGKINNNFSNLFSTAMHISSANTTTSLTPQTILQVPATGFVNGKIDITSKDNANNYQTITLAAQYDPQNTQVKFTGTGTVGTPIAYYDMNVVSGNINVTVTPLSAVIMTHTVSIQITRV